MTTTIDRSFAKAALGLTLSLALMGCATASSDPRASQQGGPRALHDGVPADCCGALEVDVLTELNRARTNPAKFAAGLEGDLHYYRGNLFKRPYDESALETREGPAAMREAIKVLRSTKPLPPLRLSNGMTHGAHDHILDQAPRGLMNHKGTDGSMAWDRVSRYGRWLTKISENMTFGPASGHDVIAALLVDDGISDRGHRKNLLDPDVRSVGLSCGPHRTFRVMCDIVHAGGFSEGK